MEGRCRYTAAVVAIAAGVVLAATGFALCFMWSNIFDAILRKELTISPKSQSFQIWKDTPVPMSLEFYFFNWTNPEDIKTPGTKPKFVEMGPYVFDEVHEKVNLTWNSNNTISFQQIRRWYFNEERSNGSLDDQITTLNVVALTAAFTVRNWRYYLQSSFSMALSAVGEGLNITKSAREFLFDGYSSPLFTMASFMPSMGELEIPYDKFGWFYSRNGSMDYDGQFTMHTGMDDISLLGKLNRWNGANTTKFFPGTCGYVNGSAGELWPPGRTKEEPVAMFSPDLCRSIEFHYTDEVDVHGITGYRYSGGLDILDNKEDCFCGGECVPAGTLNVSTCRYGAPAFVSYPHFYLADPYYLDKVEGLKPDEEKHRFYIAMEPETGIPLDVAARFQINILLQPYPYMYQFNSLPRMFFPMLWFEERATMTEEMAVSLQYLLLLPKLGLGFSIVMLLIGLAIIIIAVFLLKRRHVPKKNRWSPVVKMEVKKVVPDTPEMGRVSVRHGEGSDQESEPDPEEERLINGTPSAPKK